MMRVWREFKEFAIKGNAMDLAVGVIIGAAFNQIINSLVGDIINPILSLFTGHVDFGTLKFAIFGHAIRYGAFLNTVINFLIVAFVVFLVVKQLNRFRRREEPNTKLCSFCQMEIPKAATRCPQCTSQLT